MSMADMVNRRVVERIRSSQYSLTVHYPPARPAATGTAPGQTLLSPLTGPVVTTDVVSSDPTPSQPPVTLACLWLDMTTSVSSALGGAPMHRYAWGWIEGSEAVARVTIEDAALDVNVPFGDTVFTGAAYVEFQGKRYTVLGVGVPHSGFGAPATYYVSLIGANKQ